MAGSERFDVVVVGSGFAGSILSRILRRQGRSVLLIERAAHPRFAIGESSTPLANFCLERLAAAWRLPDLHQLATYGRWSEHHPRLRRGLKRGFTFYRHRPAEPFANSSRNENRLLVAASPDEQVADSHWLRQDIDHYLVEQAKRIGVVLRDRTEIEELEVDGDGVRLAARTEGREWRAEASLIVDGSGAGGFLAGRLGIPEELDPAGFETRLVYGHFRDVAPFVETAEAGGARMPPGPYPDERAAVHHVLDGGWMYVLPFDHGVASAGFVIREDRPGQLDEVSRGRSPEAAWAAMLRLYPTLEAQFGDARAVREIAQAGSVPRKLSAAAGPRWALLPHSFSFLDPLFSTGIAWSLQGVEKLAAALSSWDPGDADEGDLLAAALADYGSMLEAEARQLRRLLDGAWLAMADFDLLVSQSFLYFATVSFVEARLRLTSPVAAAISMVNEGYLGAGDPAMEAAFEQAVERLRRIRTSGEALGATERDGFAEWIGETIKPWNVAGLADPARHNLYPVDLDLLVERARLLDMEPDEVRRALPRLRGTDS